LLKLHVLLLLYCVCLSDEMTFLGESPQSLPLPLRHSFSRTPFIKTLLPFNYTSEVSPKIMT